MKKIIVFGEVLWDHFDGYATLGGAPLNFAYYCARHNDNRVILISAVGNDDKGTGTLNRIKDMGISSDHIKINDLETGKVTVKLNKDKSHSFTIHENVAWDMIEIDEIQFKALANPDAIYFGTLSQRTKNNQNILAAILARVSKKSFNIFDLNIRQNYYSITLIETLLMHATLFKMNDEEWSIIKKLLYLPDNDTIAVKELFKTYKLEYICITLGSKGAVLYNRFGERFFANSPKIEVVNTVGCGDAFISEMSNCLIRNEEPNKALENAVTLAAKVAQSNGTLLEF